MSCILYHNPRCSKSRATLALLEEAHIQTRIVEYLETPPAIAELDALCHKLGVEPLAIIRFGEDAARTLAISRHDQRSRQGWLQLIADNPVLMERPIVVRGDKARIGRPPESVKDLFD